mmetsp:Transcript_29391/g.78981  ORF Transcript_29391/g.78981 Transcript_29391/m.78981 type:complete len:209 (-) Transcript_29391:347-973(-)
MPEVAPPAVLHLITTTVLSIAGAASAASPENDMPAFQRVPTQFIAALGDPSASSGTWSAAQPWGIWRVDPGPMGVHLRDYPMLEKAGGRARSGWEFDANDWWLEEHGLIMPKPDFPLPPGRYIVTGDREVTTTLSVREGGVWELAEGTLYDVTHLPCRAARYSPMDKGATPANANAAEFPVTPGAKMPSVRGCKGQDYAVVFVIAIEQ